MLSTNEVVLLLIIATAFILIVSNRIRVDLVALLVLLALGITGLVPPDEALIGFSRSAVIVIMGMFVITHTLEETGVVQWISDRIRMIGGSSEKRLIAIVMISGALLALVMNIIAAGAMLLPAVMRVARDSNVRPSKLLIPMSFGTMLGAMSTYFASANVIISSQLAERDLRALNMVDFFPTGSLIAVVGIIYMLLVGRRLLPERDSAAQNVTPASLSRSLSETYHLDERMWEVCVPPGSKLVNTALSHSYIGAELGITVVAIWRGHQAILAPEPTEVINPNDYLLVLGREDRVNMLKRWGLTVGREHGHLNGRHDYSVDLTEVVIPPRSSVVGKTLVDLNFRKKYGLTSAALWREGRSYRTDVGKMPLQVGDALLMVGPTSKIRSLAQERDFMLLQGSHFYRPPSPHKAGWALGITILVLLSSIFSIVPTPEAMLAGMAALVLTKCITMDEAYRAIEWRVIFLIAGMTPVSIALMDTGLANRIGAVFTESLTPLGPLALLAGFYLLTVLITQFIGGQVSALIIAPIAITAALQAGVNPQAMGVSCAIGCASAFLTPIAHPVNVLMMSPGGYTFRDFFRVGLGMTIITFVMLLVGMTLIWGIR